MLMGRNQAGDRARSRLPGAYFQRRQPGAQAGFVPVRGIFVQHALLNGFVESGNGLAVSLLGGRLVALSERFAHVAQGGTQP
jgi:hypothetical protein